MNRQKPDPQRIRKTAESIINLPTLPTIISKMIELVDNPKTSAASLARLISTDQSLTARILKLANSAYYGFPREIATVNMAIIVLGFNTVKETGLSLSVFDIFKEGGDQGLFDITQFWEHSMGCGIAARTVARRCRPALAGEAFVAGLLHDIGKAVFKQYFPVEFVEMMRLVAGKECDLDEAEDRVVGTRHAQVGGWLVEKWHLPKRIVEGITYHHTPWDAGADPLFVAIICLANYLSHHCGIGNSGRLVAKPPEERVWEILRSAPAPVEQADLDAIESEFFLEFDKSESFISFIHDEMAGQTP